MTESPDLITQLRDALDEHAARLRAANEQSARNLRQLERIDTILEGGQIDQAKGERERKILNLVASYHLTHGNPLIAQRLAEQAAQVFEVRRAGFDVNGALREFGPALRRLREQHQIRLGELARSLGCELTALSDFELGEGYAIHAAGPRAPSTADWDALNHPPGPDEPKAHERATWHLDRALAFIDRHDGWTLRPGQDFHGYLIQARNAASKTEELAALSVQLTLKVEEYAKATVKAEAELADIKASLASVQGGARTAAEPEELLTLGPRLRAMGPVLRRLRLDHAIHISELARATDANVPMLAAIELGLEPLWDRMLDASEAKRLLGYVPAGSDLEAAAQNTLLREEVEHLKRELEAKSDRKDEQIAHSAMPAGYKMVSHHRLTEAGATTIYRWVTPMREGPECATPAEALCGAWERTTKRDREGFAELEALMQEINGILRASGRGRDSQTSVSVISEGFAELAEIKGLILASGRTMNNLSAPQVLREVLAEAGEAAQARADLEKLRAEHRPPTCSTAKIEVTSDFVWDGKAWTPKAAAAGQVSAPDWKVWEAFIADIVKLTGARFDPGHIGVMLDAITRWHSIAHRQ